MNRRSFLTQTSAWAAAAALPKLSFASAALTPEPAPTAAVGQVTFPKDFLWGSATASYQVEGAWNVDGRGPSVWDTFSHALGNVKGAWTGDIACDEYHRFPEDIAIMKHMNLRSYRYSIAWPRIQPTGTGAVNQKGIDYYKRLTDAVLAAGPSGTLDALAVSGNTLIVYRLTPASAWQRAQSINVPIQAGSSA